MYPCNCSKKYFFYWCSSFNLLFSSINLSMIICFSFSCGSTSFNKLLVLHDAATFLNLFFDSNIHIINETNPDRVHPTINKVDFIPFVYAITSRTIIINIPTNDGYARLTRNALDQKLLHASGPSGLFVFVIVYMSINLISMN